MDKRMNVVFPLKVCIGCGTNFEATLKQRKRGLLGWEKQSYCSFSCFCKNCKFTDEHRRKISIALLNSSKRRRLEFFCFHCGKKSIGKTTKKWCSTKCRYDAIGNNDPIEKKALTMSSPVKFGGKGKRKFFYSLIKNCLGKSCRYCGISLTLQNISLDHINPFGGVKERKNKLIRRELDKIDNLQVICKKCNQMKGDLHEDKFLKLLKFLSTDSEIESYVKRKLSQSAIMWSFKRHKYN